MSKYRSTSDYQFEFPESLIATQPSYPPRVLRAESGKNGQEITWDDFLNEFKSGDVLVRNSSKVVPRRIFAGDLEILFLNAKDEKTWEVLYPAKKNKIGDLIDLPGGVTAKLIEKGLPQTLEVSRPLDAAYFFEFGELPLPPYIQAARTSRHQVSSDQNWYQTCFAQKEGSLAAPTAGLHFKEKDFELLRERGVQILDVTLHVGLGTFLPIQTETIDAFQIHAESFETTESVYEALRLAHQQGRTVTTLGTTSTRVVETLARLPRQEVGSATGEVRDLQFQRRDGVIFGTTRIYLNKPEDFLWTKRLLTNFHQPQTSLLVMICAFAGYDRVMASYQFAVENKFKLFSYGDFSVWNR